MSGRVPGFLYTQHTTKIDRAGKYQSASGRPSSPNLLFHNRPAGSPSLAGFSYQRFSPTPTTLSAVVRGATRRALIPTSLAPHVAARLALCGPTLLYHRLLP